RISFNEITEITVSHTTSPLLSVSIGVNPWLEIPFDCSFGTCETTGFCGTITVPHGLSNDALECSGRGNRAWRERRKSCAGNLVPALLGPGAQLPSLPRLDRRRGEGSHARIHDSRGPEIHLHSRRPIAREISLVPSGLLNTVSVRRCRSQKRFEAWGRVAPCELRYRCPR